MNFKKNTFASILFFIVITLSSCTSQTIDIEGTTKFSSIKADNNPVQYHTVVYGDSLWDISHKYYNDPYVWPNIFKKNQITLSGYFSYRNKIDSVVFYAPKFELKNNQ